MPRRKIPIHERTGRGIIVGCQTGIRSKERDKCESNFFLKQFKHKIFHFTDQGHRPPFFFKRRHNTLS